MLIKWPTLRLLVSLHLLFALELAALFLIFRPSFGKSAATLAPVLERVIPAVVALRVTGTKRVTRELVPLAEQPTQVADKEPEVEVFRTGGSGVIIDARAGYVITNHHVIENATEIDIGLSDGRHFPATVLGRDAGSDLAILQMDGDSLPSIAIGNSDSVRVGDLVIAVGNPFGLEGTATLGIISALMRTDIGYESFEDFLQIDAQTNPGNSGGALVNDRGELIGINTVVGGARGKGFSIGFAIPINMAHSIGRELIRNGRVKRGSTGLIVDTLRYDPAASVKGIRYGAVVTRVSESSPAHLQRIRAGDVVLQVAGKPVRSASEFMTRVSTVPLGGSITMVIESQGRSRSVTLDVVALPPEPQKHQLPRQLGSIGGLVLTDIVPGNPLYGDVRGSQIMEVPEHSQSRMAGLEAGDVIVRVEGSRISSTEETIARIEQAGLQYRLEIRRGEMPFWLRMNK